VGIVVKAGETGEIVSSHEFGETILCSPAISDGLVCGVTDTGNFNESADDEGDVRPAALENLEAMEAILFRN